MLGILYILLGIALAVSIIITFKKRIISSSIIIESGLFVYYVLPNLRHIYSNSGNFISRYEHFYGTNAEPTILGFVCVLTFYFFFKFSNILKVDNGIIQKYIPNEQKKIIKLSIYITTFSILTFVLYASLFGGVMNVFKSISDIRAGFVSTKTGQFDFLNKLYRVAPFALFITADYLRSTKAHKIVLVNYVVAFLIAISTGGRGLMLQMFIILVMGKALKIRKRIKIKYIILLIFGFVFFIVLYRPLIISSQYLSSNGLVYVWSRFISEVTQSSKYNITSIGNTFSSLLDSFEHYQVSLETSLRVVNDGTHAPNLFMEIIYSIISIVPSKLLGITKPPTITYYNSMYLSGVPNLIQVPSGIIAAAYYSGGLLWVSIYAVLIGVIGKKIDRFYLKIKDHVKFSNTYYVAILFFYFGFAIGGDLATAFQKGLTTFPVLYIINKQLKPFDYKKSVCNVKYVASKEV